MWSTKVSALSRVRPDSLLVAACVTHWISADCRPHPGFSRERVIAQYLRHLSGMAHFDEIEITQIGDPTARSQALQTEGIDCMNNVATNTVHLLKRVPGLHVHATTGNKQITLPMRAGTTPTGSMTSSTNCWSRAVPNSMRQSVAASTSRCSRSCITRVVCACRCS